MHAFEQPGALEKTVKLPFGEMPAGVALNIAVFDVLTHAVDIARASGQQVKDTELIETALAVGRQMVGPELRIPGVFDAEQPCADDAPPADRLLAFAGPEDLSGQLVASGPQFFSAHAARLAADEADEVALDDVDVDEVQPPSGTEAVDQRGSRVASPARWSSICSQLAPFSVRHCCVVEARDS